MFLSNFKIKVQEIRWKGCRSEQKKDKLKGKNPLIIVFTFSL